VYLARSGNAAIRRAKELDAELKQTREELVAFKGQVTEHFSKTAELVNALTANYRSVYTHLAEGAQRFSNNDAIKIEDMQTTESQLSANDETQAPTTDSKSRSEEGIDEGWYGDHPQEPVQDESARDDRFH
jgi:uncharacterized membrane-anchored protein YhcB (DUF1043 family)